MRGNVVDMSMGIISAAFGTIVKSLVDDIIMPPVGLLLGGVGFANLFILLKAGSPLRPTHRWPTRRRRAPLRSTMVCS